MTSLGSARDSQLVIRKINPALGITEQDRCTGT